MMLMFCTFPIPAVTIDYKALTLLLNKKDQDDFILGGKGFGVEFCAFCDAIRVIIQFCYILDLYFQYPSLAKKDGLKDLNNYVVEPILHQFINSFDLQLLLLSFLWQPAVNITFIFLISMNAFKK